MLSVSWPFLRSSTHPAASRQTPRPPTRVYARASKPAAVPEMPSQLNLPRRVTQFTILLNSEPPPLTSFRHHTSRSEFASRIVERFPQAAAVPPRGLPTTVHRSPHRLFVARHNHYGQ